MNRPFLLSTLLAILLPTSSLAVPVLTNVAELARAVYNDRTDGMLFDLEATFTGYLSSEAWICFEDGSASMTALRPYQLGKAKPKPGDILRLSGKVVSSFGGATPDHISPYLVQYLATCTNGVVIGHRPVPEVRTVSGDTFVSGGCDFRRVRLRGKVIDVLEDDIDAQAAYSVLDCGGHRILTAFPLARQFMDRLRSQIGYEVEAEGVCNPAPIISRRQIGRILERTADDPFVILSPKPDDPFAVPDIGELLRIQPEFLSTHGPHRAVGQVIALSGGNTALLATETALTVKILLKDGPAPAYGDWIEAAGFPETDLYNLVLTRALWRKAPSGRFHAEETPADKEIRSLAAEDTYPNSTLRGKTLRVRGIVRSLPDPDGRNRRLIIEQDGHILAVDIAAAAIDPASLQIGTTVEVVGNFILSSELWRPSNPLPRIADVFLATRKPGDLHVIKSPPWWTIPRAMTLVGALALLLVGISVWNFTLRRLVERRSREISAATLAQAESELRSIERTKLAVELHDSLAQTLSGVAMELETSEQYAEGASPELLHHLKIAGLTLKSSRLELRNCLSDLRSKALEEPTFDRAIETSLKPFVSQIGVSVRFNVPRSLFSDNTVHAVLRIIRELVLNALRHGHATKVRVAGNFENGSLLFSVTDDGCGFDPDLAPGVLQGHFGLQGVRERVRELEGELTVESEPGKGARVAVSIRNPPDESNSK